MSTSTLVIRRMTQGQHLLDQQDSPSSTSFSSAYKKSSLCVDRAVAENPPRNKCRKPNRRVTFSDHVDMISSSFLPTRFRGEPDCSQSSAAPSRIGKKLAPLLQFLSRVACSHPIHTVVIVAVLASTSYVGLIQDSLFEGPVSLGKADWSSLVEGSRDLIAGPDTQWKWQSIEQDVASVADANHLALLTFVFPDTSSTDSSSSAPRSHVVPTPQNLSITPLPVTENSFNTYTLDSILAYSVPKKQAPEFVSAAKEIPDEQAEEIVTRHGREKKMWIMKAAKVNTPQYHCPVA
ncbi:3-hydroxy-3-methylglutaryl-coenzyme A (HMG-CoA) reductase isozyme [Metarhizium acridum]|nr:3-hydroxy-3-methylglutaryl-coenzyme A (HMG-CoA) reductase isozyme [Metarhizium acridum]